jgi:hypothetical protein
MPKRSSSEQKPVLSFIPQRNCELSAQMLEQPFLLLLPEMRNDFRIAVGFQEMAARFEFGPLLHMVEQLAIEHHMSAAVFVRHRLLAVGQSDDAQATRCHDEPRPPIEALLIRTSMQDGVRHPADDFVSRGALLSS